MCCFATEAEEGCSMQTQQIVGYSCTGLYKRSTKEQLQEAATEVWDVLLSWSLYALCLLITLFFEEWLRWFVYSVSCDFQRLVHLLHLLQCFLVHVNYFCISSHMSGGIGLEHPGTGQHPRWKTDWFHSLGWDGLGTAPACPAPLPQPVCWP